jgi:hypothetical protein
MFRDVQDRPAKSPEAPQCGAFSSTGISIRACTVGRPCLRLPDGGGLYLEVTAAGGKYWRLKYRFGGKEKRLAIGVFPTVGIADARREREAAKALLAQGIDPSASKKDRRLEARLNLGRTFESVARAWHSHWGHARSQLTTCFAAWKPTPHTHLRTLPL